MCFIKMIEGNHYKWNMMITVMNCGEEKLISVLLRLNLKHNVHVPWSTFKNQAQSLNQMLTCSCCLIISNSELIQIVFQTLMHFVI